MLGHIFDESPFAPIDRVAYERRFERLRREGVATGEVSRRRKDGSELALWVTATSVFDDAGKLLNHVRVYTDISS